MSSFFTKAMVIFWVYCFAYAGVFNLVLALMPHAMSDFFNGIAAFI